MGMRGPQNHPFRLNALVWWTIAICAIAIPTYAATITVTNTNDSGLGSLRHALAIANDGDAITFAVTGSIVLTTGELLVNKSIAISGPRVGNLVVDGNASSRVFHIASDQSVSIAGLTVRNGIATTNDGGGIYNDYAALTLTIAQSPTTWAVLAVVSTTTALFTGARLLRSTTAPSTATAPRTQAAASTIMAVPTVLRRSQSVAAH